MFSSHRLATKRLKLEENQRVSQRVCSQAHDTYLADLIWGLVSDSKSCGVKRCCDRKLVQRLATAKEMSTVWGEKKAKGGVVPHQQTSISYLYYLLFFTFSYPYYLLYYLFSHCSAHHATHYHSFFISMHIHKKFSFVPLWQNMFLLHLSMI